MSASLKVGIYAVLTTGFEVVMRKSKEASGTVDHLGNKKCNGECGNILG